MTSTAIENMIGKRRIRDIEEFLSELSHDIDVYEFISCGLACGPCSDSTFIGIYTTTQKPRK